MSNQSQDDSNDPADSARLWKVEPGIALGPFRLGAPRDEVLEVLKSLSFETCEEDLDEGELYVSEMDVTLYFDQQTPHPMLLIEVEDERVRVGNLSVLWDYPHNIFSTVAATDTLWFDDLNKIIDPNSCSAPQKELSDEQLLETGTVWIATLGVGFRLSGGAIVAVYLCDPNNLPQVGYGPFTGAQRHLSEKMQLSSYKAPISKSHPLESLIKLGLLITAILVAAFFGSRAWEEQKRWNNAPEVEAEVVAVWPAPPEPFPEKFELSYKDNFGDEHKVELGQNDVYGMPKIGDHVNLRYLLDAPGQVKGPAKLHDIGFDKFVPYLLSTFAVYFVLHFFSDWLIGRFLFRRKK
ncbi:MAG: hypothetical protein U0930_18030 [Pirellulales bacterium]